MKFVNHTPYPAMLFRTAIDEHRTGAAALLRITHALVPNGLVIAEEHPWGLSMGPWKGPRGLMEGDAVFYRGGVDLFLWGRAHAPRGRRVQRMTVSVDIGDSFHRDIVVIGDRTWCRKGGSLSPGEPEWFSSLSLGPENAYGGKAEWDGLELPWQENPEGKGYYLEEDAAEESPLPNLEEPDAPIVRWDDRPDTVFLGPCPPHAASRFKETVVFDEQGRLREIRPRFFNAAHPKMVAKTVEPGALVRLTGVSPDGPVTFRLPQTVPMVRLSFDEEVHEVRARIDQVGIDLIDRKVFITWRYPFRYHVHPLQKRRCEVRYPDRT